MSNFRRALARWIDRQNELAGVEALFTEPLRRDPAEVGRQRTLSAQIRDVVRWLERSGWAGWDRGRLQQYALYLLEQRAKYERPGAAR